MTGGGSGGGQQPPAPWQHIITLSVAAVLVAAISIVVYSPIFSSRVERGPDRVTSGASLVTPDAAASAYVTMEMVLNLDEPSGSVLRLTGFIRNENRASGDPFSLMLVMTGALVDADPTCGRPEVSSSQAKFDDLQPDARRAVMDYVRQVENGEVPGRSADLGPVNESIEISDQQLESRAKNETLLTVELPLADEFRDPVSQPTEGGPAELVYDSAQYDCVFDASRLVAQSGSQRVVTSPIMSVGRPADQPNDDNFMCAVFTVIRTPGLTTQFSSNDSLQPGPFSRCHVPQDQAIAWGQYVEYSPGTDDTYYRLTSRSAEYAVFESASAGLRIERHIFLLGAVIGAAVGVIGNETVIIAAWAVRRRREGST